MMKKENENTNSSEIIAKGEQANLFLKRLDELIPIFKSPSSVTLKIGKFTQFNVLLETKQPFLQNYLPTAPEAATASILSILIQWSNI